MLTLDAIGSNAVAILERLELHEKEVSCSWLPLSHDMGLIGLLVAAWAARGPRWSTTGEGEVILIRPEAFVARPSVWLEACSTFGATFTAAPSSALRLTARILAAGRRPVDLSSIRALITGAEAIRADNLRAFSEAARPAGFDDRAFCPAYGLAEATLAVTLTPPSQHWHSRCTGRRNTGSMHDGLGDATFEVVSSGKPVSGVRVRTSPNGARMGTIEVSSPSLLSGYVGESESPTTNDGWLPTEDIGEIVDDELFVVGRTDDVVSLAGRNVLAPELERIAAEDPAVRGDSCAVTIEDDRLVLVAELGRGVDRSDLPGAARRVRSALLERSGFAPGRVVFVSKSQLPRTPSGKLQRHLIALRLHAGDLPIEFEG